MALSRRRGWTLALVATFTMSISYFDRQTFAALAPRFSDALHIDEEAYGWLTSAFSIAYLVGAPIAGVLVDRVGARRGLFLAVIAWTIVAAMHALAPGIAALFALRIALGLAESPSFPGAAQTVDRALAKEEKARGFGVLFVGSSVGAMLAPLTAAFLERRYGWRSAFLGSALVGALWIPVWLGVAFRKDARALLDRVTPRRAADRGAFVRALRDRNVQRAIAMVAAVAPIVGFVLAWSSKYLRKRFGLDLTQMGVLLVVPPIAYDLGSVLFGHFVSRARARGRPIERAAMLLASILGAAIALIAVARTPFVAIASASVALAGCGGAFAIFTEDVLRRVDPSRVSTVSGITAAAQSIAIVATSPLIGRAVAKTGGYGLPVVCLASLLVPGAAFWLLTFETPPPEAANREV